MARDREIKSLSKPVQSVSVRVATAERVDHRWRNAGYFRTLIGIDAMTSELSRDRTLSGKHKLAWEKSQLVTRTRIRSALGLREHIQ